MLTAAGETETMREDIQGWLELEEDPVFHLHIEEDIPAVLTLRISLNFPSAHLLKILFYLIGLCSSSFPD